MAPQIVVYGLKWGDLFAYVSQKRTGVRWSRKYRSLCRTRSRQGASSAWPAEGERCLGMGNACRTKKPSCLRDVSEGGALGVEINGHSMCPIDFNRVNTSHDEDASSPDIPNQRRLWERRQTPVSSWCSARGIGGYSGPDRRHPLPAWQEGSDGNG